MKKSDMNNTNFYESAADTGDHLLIERYTDKSPMKPTEFCHFHNSIEIAVIRSGKCYVHINAENRLLSEGDIAFIDSFSPHFYNSTDGSDIYVIVIDRQLVCDLNSEQTFDSYLYGRECANAVCDFADSVSGCYYDNLFIRRGVANMILGIIKRFYSPIKRKKEKSQQIFVEVLKYIESSYGTDITLKELSQKFGYVPNYFSDLFNKFTGMHLREYLNRRRIREVCRIKRENPDTPLSKIAYECGFSSENTFYRAYRAYKND